MCNYDDRLTARVLEDICEDVYSYQTGCAVGDSYSGRGGWLVCRLQDGDGKYTYKLYIDGEDVSDLVVPQGLYELAEKYYREREAH